jgi:hypothetical protein
VREAVLAQTDAGSEPAYSMRCNVVYRAAPQPLPRCLEGRRMIFAHPISAHPSRLAPVRGPGASRVCSTHLCYTAVVSPAPGAHAGPTASVACPCRRCVSYPCHAADPSHTSHLAATRGTQHSPDRLIGHAVITRDVAQRFPLFNTLEHSCPCRGRDLPARIRYGLRVGRQRQKPRMVKGRGERIISW